MVAASIMTTGVTRLAPTDTVLTALKAVQEAGAVELPVVDKEGVLAGMVSAERLFAVAFEPGEEPGRAGSAPEGLKAARLAALALEPVSVIMDTAPMAVTPETPANRVAAHFFESKPPARCLPVIDNQKRLLGVITPLEMTTRLCEYIEKTL